jgi:hypothetical protein
MCEGTEMKDIILAEMYFTEIRIAGAWDVKQVKQRI